MYILAKFQRHSTYAFSEDFIPKLTFYVAPSTNQIERFGKKSMKHVGLLNKHQSDLPRPIKIGLGCVYGVELCTKLQHSVCWKCVRKIVLKGDHNPNDKYVLSEKSSINHEI